MADMNKIEISLVNMLQEVLNNKAAVTDVLYYVVDTMNQMNNLPPVTGAMCTVNSNDSGTQGTYVYNGTTWVFKF